MALPDRRLVAFLAVLVVVPAFAGCASDDDGDGERVSPGATLDGRASTGSDASPGVTSTPRPRSPSERWHFHDYWQGSPTITLLDTNVSFAPGVGDDGVPVLHAIVSLPQNVIVPPETGELTFNVTWEGSPGGLVNLTYRPADTTDFLPAGDVEKGTPLVVGVSESQADVPHRQQSFWRFNLTAKPGGNPPAVPDKDVRFTISATIGRPLFIDPPHVDWWSPGEIIPLVSGFTAAFQGATTPAANLTLPGDPDAIHPASFKPASVAQPQRVPVDVGRIVPEGARSLVVMLNWTSELPNQKLKVRWTEGNSLTEGFLDVVAETPTGRVFAIPITPGQTDTTYSNRTTWEFFVIPEGDPPAFRGAFTFTAWASRFAPADAAARVAGGA